MSMKKILMAAAAVTALTAGSASALTLSAIKFSGISLTPASTGVTATSYGVADSVITTTSSNMVTTVVAAENQITGTLSGTTGRFAQGGAGTTYVATYTLSGTANPVFNNVVQPSNFTTNNAGTGCAVSTPNVVGGGAIGTNSVQISFNIPSTCSTTVAANYSPDSVTLKDIQIKTTAAGNISASLGFKTALDNANYDGAPVSHPLVVSVSPYVVSATADTVTTLLAAGTGATPYTSLKPTATGFDSTIGNLKFVAATAGSSIAGGTIYANLAATALPTITADVSLKATSGNFSTIVPTIGTSTTGAVSTSDATLFNDSGLAATATTGSPVTVAIASGNTTSLPSVQTYTASITPKLSSATLVSVPASVTDKPLQSIGLEGTNFLAPWIAGSQSPSGFVLRIANNATNATSPVTLTLKSPIYNAGTTAGATTCTSANLPALAKINGGGELLLGVTEMTTCFGDFKRGDLLVTVQAPKDNLSAKARLTTASGQVTEVSLGGLSVTGESY